MELKDNQLLRSAFNDYICSVTADIPSEETLSETLSFSPRFIRRMSRLLRRARSLEAAGSAPGQAVLYPHDNSAAYRAPVQWRRRLVLLAVIAAVLVSAVSAVAAREEIRNFFITIYEKYTSVIFDRQAGTAEIPVESVSSAVSDLPSYIPEGYEVGSRLVTDNYIQIIYSKADALDIIFERNSPDNLTAILDTEGTQYEKIPVDRFEGIYFSNKGIQNLLWQDEYYVYGLSGPASREDLTAIAQSVYK